MIKCIYRKTTKEEKHCDKEADYMYQGKSYCAEHLKIRGDEYEEMAKNYNETTK